MTSTTQNRQGRSGSTANKHRSASAPHANGNKRRSFSAHNKRGGGFKTGRTNGRPNFKRGGSHGGGNRGGGRKMPTFDPTQFINKNPIDVVEDVYTPKNTFHTFGLNQQLVQTVTEMGITVPSPIQDQVIPQIMDGHDVIGLAATGTGKTAAFLLPLIEKTIPNKRRQTLVLAPTRELAVQIEKELRALSKGFKFCSVVCVGGTGIFPQIKALKHRNQFVIGTPGRIMDLMDRGSFRPSDVTTVVLDEADRMLDMGFIHDMKKILGATPKNRETLLFSATMTKAAEELTHEFLRNPVMVSVKKKDVTDSIKQDVVAHAHGNKFETLVHLLQQPAFTRVIVFGSMKHSVEKLSKQLCQAGIKADSIHGNKSHGQRQRSLGAFKTGRAQVLVATDVAARGIHVDDVSHVINYDLPTTFEDYVHRIGRTGRGSKRGEALTFIQQKATHR